MWEANDNTLVTMDRLQTMVQILQLGHVHCCDDSSLAVWRQKFPFGTIRAPSGMGVVVQCLTMASHELEDKFEDKHYLPRSVWLYMLSWWCVKFMSVVLRVVQNQRVRLEGLDRPHDALTYTSLFETELLHDYVANLHYLLLREQDLDPQNEHRDEELLAMIRLQLEELDTDREETTEFQNKAALLLQKQQQQQQQRHERNK